MTYSCHFLFTFPPLGREHTKNPWKKRGHNVYPIDMWIHQPFAHYLPQNDSQHPCSIPEFFSTASTAWQNKAPVKQHIGRLAMGAQQGRSWLYAVHDRYTERCTTHKGDVDLCNLMICLIYLTCICSHHCRHALQLNKTIHHIQIAKTTHSPAQHNPLRSSKYTTLAAEEVRSNRCRVTQCHSVIHLESDWIRWVSCAALEYLQELTEDMQEQDAGRTASNNSWHSWHSKHQHKRARKSTDSEETHWNSLGEFQLVLGLSWTSTRAGVRLACVLQVNDGELIVNA